MGSQWARSIFSPHFSGCAAVGAAFSDHLGLPQIGLIVDPIPAGLAALSLRYGGYMTEIYRAGIRSIDPGQWEASAALGLKKGVAFRKVIMPQAFKIIIPPTGNSFIAMLKDSSLVSVVGVWDLMYVARSAVRSKFRILEMLITAALIYWALSFLLELGQAPLEERFRRSAAN
ncbi:Inner membrane amino-acid ABC transporter permease protein YecS [Ruegeria denitrificans]|uniref:Inner membrane amino-acid ABC transporter permease protein YecS n=2 Tax=Ruegeria denitrificans TaxID=1715692 RepID=A0A0P1I8A0_9RHOB|nr:Inner membrane amino-acid ABC transporter permease protein YecS [Ruegeria denitrificans]